MTLWRAWVWVSGLVKQAGIECMYIRRYYRGAMHRQAQTLKSRLCLLAGLPQDFLFMLRRSSFWVLCLGLDEPLAHFLIASAVQSKPQVISGTGTADWLS